MGWEARGYAALESWRVGRWESGKVGIRHGGSLRDVGTGERWESGDSEHSQESLGLRGWIGDPRVEDYQGV